MSIGITHWHSAGTDERRSLLQRPAMRDRTDVAAGVREIINAVRCHGDDAVRELTERLDGVQLEDFAVSESEFDAKYNERRPEPMEFVFQERR